MRASSSVRRADSRSRAPPHGISRLGRFSTQWSDRGDVNDSSERMLQSLFPYRAVILLFGSPWQPAISVGARYGTRRSRGTTVIFVMLGRYERPIGGTASSRLAAAWVPSIFLGGSSDDSFPRVKT